MINLSIRSIYLISNVRLKQQQRNEKLKYHFLNVILNMIQLSFRAIYDNLQH